MGTEFGWYQSSSQKGHPFGTTFPLGNNMKTTTSRDVGTPHNMIIAV